MRKKTAGKINQPPEQADFDKINLTGFCTQVQVVFYRLHSTNLGDPNGNPWAPVHFSKRNNTRFDPKSGVGTLCVGETLAGAMMEVFDDQWGPVGSIGRSVTEAQLSQTWVTRVSLPNVSLFDATGPNLSKIGTDAQVLTGKYTTTRKWAVKMMLHPDQIDGVLYRSRHDLDRKNIALFGRARFLPAIHDQNLLPFEPDAWARNAGHGTAVVHGDAMRLRNHPELDPALIELQVARIP